MHVPWGWIKQRPHFIAEGLNKYADVQVITIRSFFSKNLKNESDLNVKVLYRLPFERFTFILKLNTILYRLQLKKYLKSCDTIWLTSPYFYNVIPQKLYSEKKIIYDCMDDILEFPNIKNNIKLFNFYHICEYRLFKNASFILSSANFLKKKLIDRYGERDNIYIVNNAIKNITDNKSINSDSYNSLLKDYLDSKAFKLVYIGTISGWMDFNLLQEILSKCNNVEIYMFGPNEIPLPQINGINYFGRIEHDAIFKVMDNADILIMPFVVNELIKSVNPVKLYEYIYSGKPCIAPLYDESKYFNEYVYLYNNNKECIELINNIQQKKYQNKNSIEKCREYCRNNTWEKRIKTIFNFINQ